MKVFEINDDDLYAANDEAEALAIFKHDSFVWPGPTIHELTDAQLDRRYQAYDQDERPIPGQTISVREMLAEHGDKPGWLAGMM